RLRPKKGYIGYLAISADGRYLAAGGYEGQTGGALTVWDAATGKALEGFEPVAAPVACLAFAPDGHTLAAGVRDHTIRFWEAATGRERHRITGHEGDVHSIAYSSDGRRLAAASPEAPAYVWDLADPFRLAGSKLTAEACEACWRELVGDDAAA